MAEEEKVQFELVSPEEILVSEAVDMVVVPGSEGDFGIMPRHALFLSSIRPGVVRVFTGGAETWRIFVAGGFAEATAERCTVLADEAIQVKDIDRAATEARLKDLREDLTDAKDDEARAAVARRIRVAEAMLAAAAEA